MHRPRLMLAIPAGLVVAGGLAFGGVMAAGGLDVNSGGSGLNGSGETSVTIVPGSVCVSNHGQGLNGSGGADVNIGPNCPGGTTTTTTEGPTTTTTTEGPTTTTTTEAPGNQTLLSLRAVVINRFGGTATTADFDLFANGPVRISGVTGNPAVTRALVPPGTYNLSDVEDALAEATDPYATSGWDCSGSADTTPESVTMDAGEVAVCTVVFSDAPAPGGTSAPGGAGSPSATGTSGSGSGGGAVGTSGTQSIAQEQQQLTQGAAPGVTNGNG